MCRVSCQRLCRGGGGLLPSDLELESSFLGFGLRDANEDRAGASSRKPRGAVCCAAGTESSVAQTRNVPKG